MQFVLIAQHGPALVGGMQSLGSPFWSVAVLLRSQCIEERRQHGKCIFNQTACSLRTHLPLYDIFLKAGSLRFRWNSGTNTKLTPLPDCRVSNSKLSLSKDNYFDLFCRFARQPGIIGQSSLCITWEMMHGCYVETHQWVMAGQLLRTNFHCPD